MNGFHATICELIQVGIPLWGLIEISAQDVRLKKIEKINKNMLLREAAKQIFSLLPVHLGLPPPPLPS